MKKNLIKEEILEGRSIITIIIVVMITTIIIVIAEIVSPTGVITKVANMVRTFEVLITVIMIIIITIRAMLVQTVRGWVARQINLLIGLMQVVMIITEDPSLMIVLLIMR